MSWSDIHISVDLASKARPYLDFLEGYLRNPSVWTSPNIIRRAIYRYERFWLPLVSDAKRQSNLEAPKDIRWIWHLHMLLVGHYTKYCKTRFGRVIPHVLHTSPSDTKAAQKTSEELWRVTYSDEPFELDVQRSSKQSTLPSAQLGELMDLALQQDNFFYQVALPHYRDKQFLSTAVDRYRKFLHAQNFCAGSCRDTPHDIKLMWRVHVLHPQDYLQDVAFLKQLYDPYEQSHEDDELLSNQAVKQKWEKLYPGAFFIDGTIVRGQSFSEIVTFPKEKELRETVDLCTLTIDSVEISDPEGKAGMKDTVPLRVDIRRLNDSSFSYLLIARIRGYLAKRIPIKHPDNNISFDRKSHKGLEFHIYSKTGRCCFVKEQSYATLFYSPMKNFRDGSFYNRTIDVELPKVVSTDPVVKFTCHVKAEAGNPHILLFERQPFTQQACPAELSRCVQDELSWHDLIRDNADFLVGIHRYVCIYCRV